MRRQKSKDQIDLERREQRAELHRRIYEGRLVAEILEAEGWSKIMLPLFAAEEERLVKESRFNPANGDIPSVERLAFLNSYNSGAISMLSSIQAEMIRRVNEADEAARQLKNMDQRSQHETKIV